MTPSEALQYGTESAELRQDPAAALPNRLWDVLVVGAGPAGSTTAFHLTRRGHGVVLVERERFPREKTCGDVLLGDAARALQRMGLDDEIRGAAHSVHTLYILSPSHIDVQLPGSYLTIHRQLLDAMLVRKAVETGTRFSLGHVRGIRAEADGTLTAALGTSSTTLRARMVVLATGAASVLQEGLARPPSPSGRSRAVALRCYVRSAVELDHMVFCYHRSLLPGYAWVIPMGNSEFNVGCGVFGRGAGKRRVNLAQAFREFAAEVPVARAILEGCESRTPLKGAQLRCGLRDTRPLGIENVLAVGEAIGSTYPLTGEGIGKAMETGEMGAEAVHRVLASGDRGELRRYQERIRSLRRRYRAYEIAERWLSFSWFGDFLAHRARKSLYLRAAGSRVLSDLADPREIVSITGILRSFLE